MSMFNEFSAWTMKMAGLADSSGYLLFILIYLKALLEGDGIIIERVRCDVMKKVQVLPRWWMLEFLLSQKIEEKISYKMIY